MAQRLLGEIRELIDQTRQRTAQAVNAGLVFRNWHIGNNIHKEILGEERAEYGQQIVALLAKQLTSEYGRGFSRQALFHMIRFAEAFPDPEIVSTLSRQLGWSHFMEIIYKENSLKRDFYAEMCRIERWSVRTLRDKINGMLTNAPLSRKTRMKSSAGNSMLCATKINFHPIWSFAILTSLTSSI